MLQISNAKYWIRDEQATSQSTPPAKKAKLTVKATTPNKCNSAAQSSPPENAFYPIANRQPGKLIYFWKK